ncbi:unnamed protein product [Gongylonema pulchrum]|uniref:Exonuclease domain-containing protein n=1 Tax=Gongylonema pulchrum TaxID=637853 RepID=A0A183DNF4_9BILA|nr:unnamed protein product [Gongylonema pulchrum]
MVLNLDHRPNFIQSFVFLDIEASGIFPVDHMNPMEGPPIPANCRQAPHAMEISLVSITRKAILSGIRRMHSLIQNSDDVESSGTCRISDIRFPANVYTAQVFFL